MPKDKHVLVDHPADAAPVAYGCASCAKTSCFRGDLDGMPKTCPTRTHEDVATDHSPYLVKDRVFDHQPVRALRPERAPG